MYIQMFSAYFHGKPTLHGFGLLLIIVLLSTLHARIIPQSDIIISQTPLTSLTFGSCNKQNKPQPMWEFIHGGNGTSSVGTHLLSPPEAFIWLGDVIYGDSIVWPFEFIRYASSMEVMRDKYNEQSSNPGYKQLIESPIAVVGVWDDHDYGLNDGDRHYVDRAKTQQLFLDFMGDAIDSKRRTRDGVYGSYVWGPEGKRVLLILLDIRYHQDYAVDDILGSEQWSWLNHTLIQYDPQLIILGSGIQFLSRDKPIGEGWRSFPRSKALLFQLLHSTNMIRRNRWNTKYASTNSTTSRPYVPAGHLFLSGDVHFAEISSTSWCEVHPTSTSSSSSHPTYHDGDELWIYPLHEITSSGLTHSVAGQTFGLVDFAFKFGTPDRIVWTRQNFGRIDIHWDTRTDAERHPVSAAFPPPPSFSSRTFIHINIYNVTGEPTPVFAKWKLSDLQPILKKVVISHNITSPSYPFEPIQHLIPHECVMEQKLAIGMVKLYSISGIKGAVISIGLGILSLLFLLRLLYILCIRRHSRPVVLRQLSKKNK